jgi:Serine/threonine protein phosphatase
VSSTVRVEYGACSDIRPKGAPNEDHYLVVRLGRSQETLATSLSEAETPMSFSEAGYAFVVADGLGGTGSGGVASRLAISTLVHLVVHYGRWNVRVDARTAFEILERASTGRTTKSTRRSNDTAGAILSSRPCPPE